MILQVFCVFDSATGTFDHPQMLHAIGEAKRAFIEVVNDPKSKLNKYPGDYSLFHLAEYNTLNGSYTNMTAPIRLMLATEALHNA